MTIPMEKLESYLSFRRDTMLSLLTRLQQRVYFDKNGTNSLPDSILKSGKLNNRDLDLCISFKGCRLKQVDEDASFILKSYNHLFTEAELQRLSDYITSIHKSYVKITEIISLRKEQISSWKRDFTENTDRENIQSEQLRDRLLQLLTIDDKQCMRLLEELNAFQRWENMIKEFAVRIWQEQLTNPQQYQEGQSFKFVAHCLTKGTNFLQGEITAPPHLSASLLTERHLGTYGKRNYGFIYPVLFENLLLISKDDLYSNSFAMEAPEVGFFYYEHIGEHQILMFSELNSSKTITPEQIELECIRKTLEVNQELLNYDNRSIYNEILLHNNEYSSPLAVFCIVNGDRHYNSDFTQAQRLAKELKLDLLVIDKALYRERLDLSCLTEKEKQNILEALTVKCLKLSFHLYSRMRDEINAYAEASQGKWDRSSLFHLEINNIYKKSRLCKSVEEFNDCLMHEMTTITDKYQSLNSCYA